MSELEMSPSEQDMAYEQMQENARKERIEKYGFDVLDQSLWKTFQSTKCIKSVPMTRGMYNDYQGWEIPAGENPADEGYLVEYLDGGKANHPDHEGYISWSPKDVFDRNHRPMGRGESPFMVTLDEAPFVNVHAVEVDINAENFNEVFRAHAEGSIKSLHITNVDNIPADEVAKKYAFAATARRFIKVELDPNEPDQVAAMERLKTVVKSKEMSLSGSGGPRGLVAGLQMLDEASFGVHWGSNIDIAKTYPPFGEVIPMTIYKSTPLENGMALGVIETLSDVNGKLTFSDALQALKFGYRVQRSGWNGKDMWLSVSNLNTATVPADKFWSPHNSQYATENGGSAEVPPCITMKNAKGQIQMGWLPSQEDCFSSDWYVFEKVDEFTGTDDIATMTGLMESQEKALDGLSKPLTESFESSTEEVDIQAGLAGIKRERKDPSFKFVERHYHEGFQEVAKQLPYNFTGEQLLELLRQAAPTKELGDDLYYAPGDVCYGIGLRNADRSFFVKDVDENTIRFNGNSEKESVTYTKQEDFLPHLFRTFFEFLFPVGLDYKVNPMELGQSLFEMGEDFNDNFGAILIHKQLLKTKAGKALGDLLTIEMASENQGYPCTITNVKNGWMAQFEQDDGILTTTLISPDRPNSVYSIPKDDMKRRGEWFCRLHDGLFPLLEVGPYIEKGQRFQFDCVDERFLKVKDQLERFLDNGARASHGPHRNAMHEVQLSVMSLLTKLLDSYGSDIGEHGEVLTNLSFAEALLFTESNFEIRHASWKPNDKLTPTLSDMEYVFMRTGEETPWVATDEELRSDGWILLYKEN